MPAKYRVKEYVSGGVYQVFNKGIEGRTIFAQDQDYYVFLSLLHHYFSPEPEKGKEEHPLVQAGVSIVRPRPVKRFHGRAELLAFSLLPNHFHLVIQQHDESALKEIMTSLGTIYSMYFNKKYNRQGTLFQGRYKGVLLKESKDILLTSHAIHQEPRSIITKFGLHALDRYPYSSFQYYVKDKQVPWLNTKSIYDAFSAYVVGGNIQYLKYKDFIEQSDPTLSFNYILE